MKIQMHYNDAVLAEASRIARRLIIDTIKTIPHAKPQYFSSIEIDLAVADLLVRQPEIFEAARENLEDNT